MTSGQPPPAELAHPGEVRAGSARPPPIRGRPVAVGPISTRSLSFGRPSGRRRVGSILRGRDIGGLRAGARREPAAPPIRDPVRARHRRVVSGRPRSRAWRVLPRRPATRRAAPDWNGYVAPDVGTARTARPTRGAPAHLAMRENWLCRYGVEQGRRQQCPRGSFSATATATRTARSR